MAPKPTGQLLKQLRNLMKDTKYVPEAIQAYIVPSNDAHNSEYTAECDNLRAFISGFTGSAGTAVITEKEAALWTDGRYFLQASMELDENWILMKEGIPSTPSQDAWLSKVLPQGSRIGVDPKIYTASMWNSLQNHLHDSGHKLVPVIKNLVDVLWTDRPPRPANPVHPLPLKFTGQIVNEKLEIIRKKMKEKNAQLLVLTMLDEIAWLLNLRGSDIQYNPVFFAYAAIKHDNLVIFINNKQVTDEVKKHLNDEIGEGKYEIKGYDEIADYIQKQTQEIDGLSWFSNFCNYALVSLVPKKNLLMEELTPVVLLKVVKNPVEQQGLKNAHIKDAAALCCYFAWLEKSLANGEKVTEISGANKLEEFRAQQDEFKGPSFATISSVGAHGAIIHYQPEPETDIPITTDSLYLCDSGGQYSDGTTDVTRTIHFGTPTDYEKECYTRVLKGQLALGRTIFPNKIVGNYLDSFARQYLWQVGLDYAHGTSHGIGAYLNVHEGPCYISWRHYPADPGVHAGMFFSNEPGYYEDGKFGIRIEDIMQVVKANTSYNFKDKGFLKFETITLVPKQTKLIILDLLTNEEIDELNEYHQKCRDIIGPVLERQGQFEAKEWLWRESEPIKRK